MKKFYLLKTLLLFIFFIPAFTHAQEVNAVEKICITVKDLNTAVKFYTKVLPFTVTGYDDAYGDNYEKLMGKFGIHYKTAHLQLGNEKIDLIDYLTSGGRSISETQQSNDLIFQHIAIVVSNMDKAVEQLIKNDVEFVSTNPQTIPASNAAAAGIRAFYFHDMDNHSLELIYFPKGKGNPVWQQISKNIFLGIDHSAIGISNTENSLLFWQNILKLEVKGVSHNVGTEQAHLNNVQNAEVHITGLRAAKGPGVEFLEYIQPGKGKIYPADTQCDDLWNWITKVKCTDADALYQQLKLNNTNIISDGVVMISGIKNFIARDPDGHAVWFSEEN